jgi:5-methyltetrahydropteroyltriglutamate--homocysteine methyltransferase
MASIFSGEDRILTTHSGRLPRRPALMDRVLAKADSSFDPVAHEARVSAAVETCVRKQAESGIDIVADGEERTSFALYLQDRVAGLEPRPSQDFPGFKKKFAVFLEDFERCLQKAARRGTTVVRVPIACAGPMEYVGEDELHRDLDNLRLATAKVDCSAAFMASIAPGAIESNEYYSSEAAFLEAAGEALRTEYKAIVAAGFLLQIDDPLLPACFSDREHTHAEADRRARVYVDMLNHSLRGIPEEKIRYHISCGGTRDSRLAEMRFVEVAKHMLRVNAAAYSFDASNMRHEEDNELWRAVRFPAGKVLVPGLISSADQHVEDPEQLSRRIVGFANRVGRNGVIASVTDLARPRANDRSDAASPSVWAKFEALRDGARRASRTLWRSPHASPIVAVRAAAF